MSWEPRYTLLSRVFTRAFGTERQGERGFEGDSELDEAYPAFILYAPLSSTSVLDGSGCAFGVEGLPARACLDVPMIRVGEQECSNKASR